MNVLITAASAAQAYKLEKEISYADHIFFADSFDLPEIMIKERRFIKIPKDSSVSFAHQLLTICLDLNIKQVFPLRKLEIEALAEARHLFDEYDIRVMTPRQHTIHNFYGTYKTGQLLIKGLHDDLNKDSEPDRGVFLFNIGGQPDLQLLTVD